MSRFIATIMQPANRPLGEQMLRGASIAQALVAFPCFIYMAKCAWDQWSNCFDDYAFWFLSYVALSAATSGIIFIAAVQRRSLVTSYQALKLEVAKSLLATGLWMWTNRSYASWKKTGLTTFALVLFFYIPLWYTFAAYKEDKRSARLDIEENYRDVEDVKAPLLQG